MRPIVTEKDYEPIAEGVERILDTKKVLPEKVFNQSFKYFLFLTFDELSMRPFFNNIKRYLSESGEANFWLTAIKPDPKIYFGFHFNFFGAIEFSTSDTEDDYLGALHDYPEESPADALVHNTSSLMAFSSTNMWAIYGDRDAEIAICAFTGREQMDLFKTIYGSDLLLGEVKNVGEYAYGGSGNTPKVEKFCNSYLSS